MSTTTEPWLKCLFEPLDAFCVADARPLDEGGFGHDGELYPDAFAGALRTCILQRMGYTPSKRHVGTFKALADRLGVPADKEQIPGDKMEFRFAGPLLCDGAGNTLWPLPRSYVWSHDKNHLSELQIEHSSAIIAVDRHLRTARLLRTSDWEARPVDAIDYFDELARWLSMPLERSVQGERWQPLHTVDDVVLSERRGGHTRSRRGVAEDARLFSRAFGRFACEKDGGGTRLPQSFGFVGFVRGVAGLLSPGEQHIVRLGGDGRLAVLKAQDAQAECKAADALKVEVLEHLKPKSLVRLYLATPAIFREEGNGWSPPGWDTNGFKLLAAAIDKPRLAAGWDSARGRPKAPVRIVPQGATYFLEVTDPERAAGFIEARHFNEALTHDRIGIGYGLALFGPADASMNREELREES